MTFVEAYAEIIENTEDNEVGRSFLLENLFANPSANINNEIRSALHKGLEKNRKKQYKCGHDSCSTKSCYSHEISENVFLKNLADEKSKVLILKPDFKNSAFGFAFDSVHKRNASNFPGYCSTHDSELFSDIESQFAGVDRHFINKHCLRVIRREKFKLASRMNACREFIAELMPFNSEDAKNFLNRFENKLAINEKSMARACSVYESVNEGINSGAYVIDYQIFDVSKSGYCFSTMLDFTKDEDTEPAVFFLVKLEYGSKSQYIVCHLDNALSAKEVTKLYPDSFGNKSFLSEVMHRQKERFVFSKSFINLLDEPTYRALVSNHECFELSPFDKAFLAEVFF
jgi:hypothetical protein